ncbi:MAG: PepSY-associated TM helix domain-containing protein [Pseudomonadota bacterium]
MKTIKRFLFLLHRWIGVTFSLLILLWFASGIVMMYVAFPTLTPSERFAHAPVLQTERLAVSPLKALEALSEAPRPIAALRLSTVLQRPAYLVKDANGQWSGVFADDGAPISNIGPDAAEQAARGFAGDGATATHLAESSVDQWSVSGSLNGYRPLHKVAVADGRGAILYVSSRTGQVVRDTSRWERNWNWVGAVVHWIYPTALRRHTQAWVNVVIVLSLGGLIAAISGTIVGIMRVRVKRRYRSGSVSPYSGLQFWHHLGGLLSAVFVITFLFSGLMSMNPWGVFDNRGESKKEQIARYTNGALDLSRFSPDVSSIAAALPDDFEPREIEWLQHTNGTYLVFTDAKARRVALSAMLGRPARRIENMIDRVDQHVGSLMPDATILEKKILSAYDEYYYARHERYKPLPIMRVKFDDESNTWFHIDGVTGQVLSRSTKTDRIKRWLYNGLHSLDFRILVTNRPLWDIIVIILSLLGIGFSLTGVVIGWRRLKIKGARILNRQ